MNPQQPSGGPAPQYDPTAQQAQQPTPNPAQEYKAAYERPKEKGVHTMVVLQPGEVIVCNIKRHAFGIVSLYASAIIGMAVAGALAFLMLPDFLNQVSGQDSGAALSLGIAVSIIVLLILMLGVATSVYWQNEWVVTTDSITQITQNSLFGRQVSQLSMDNLEDVTVTQDGIIPHMFGFGTLKVESAGERSKFVFPYCPNPNDYARKILEVHEHFLEERRNVQFRGQATFSTNNPPQQINTTPTRV